MGGFRGSLVPLLEADPDLGRWLGPKALAWAQNEVVVEALTLGRGPWTIPATADHAPPPLGLLVLEGALMRAVVLRGHRGIELLGEGDFVQPWLDLGPSASVPFEESWSVLAVTRVAVVDHRAASKLARLEGVLGELSARTAAQAVRLGIHRAAARLPNLPSRVLALLWSVADRWGRVEPGRVVIPLRLSHDLIGAMVGARRPSVSSAVCELAALGMVERSESGRWALVGDPMDALDRLSDLHPARHPPRPLAAVENLG